MKLFQCQNCGSPVYFENRICERCLYRLGYLPEPATISALETNGDEWRALAAPDGRVKFCANAVHDTCNWLIDSESAEDYCVACRHNRTIPDVSQAEQLERWRKFELAKHRLFYSLMRLGLPLANRADDPEEGLAFDFLEEFAGDARRVLTGHDNGLITLSLREADDVEREKRRAAMDETYRTLLGHLRHETGHYFWNRLVRDQGRLDAFRETFGDERQDYGEALKVHYADGPPPDWQERFISAYASAHPWEDFAETWAHYLHMADTLETGSAFGLRVRPEIDDGSTLSAELDFDPYAADAEQLIKAWLPLTFAVNAINRSMGEPDLYPFILSPAAIGKIAFVQKIIHDGPRTSPDGA